MPAVLRVVSVVCVIMKNRFKFDTVIGFLSIQQKPENRSLALVVYAEFQMLTVALHFIKTETIKYTAEA